MSESNLHEIETPFLDENRVDIVYDINEGEISRVHKIDIIGNKFFIEEFLKYLPINGANTYYKQSSLYVDDLDKQTISFFVYKKHGSLEAMNFLYGNSPTLYLPRKYELAQHWLSLRG